MLIDDGYTESMGAFRIRRFIASERDEFNLMIREERITAAKYMFAKHITGPDGNIVSLGVVPQHIADMVLHNEFEKENLQNLKTGFRLMLENPRLAIRSCDLCQKWWFDEDTGTIVKIGGKLLPRAPHALTMCQAERGCQRGTPEKLLAFNEINQKAFNHWQQWRAVGCPAPNDAIVRRNWMYFSTLRENHGLRELSAKLSQPKK